MARHGIESVVQEQTFARFGKRGWKFPLLILFAFPCSLVINFYIQLLFHNTNDITKVQQKIIEKTI